MSYEHIYACKNDCALFWKKNENLDKCLMCEAPRYKDTCAQDITLLLVDTEIEEIVHVKPNS